MSDKPENSGEFDDLMYENWRDRQFTQSVEPPSKNNKRCMTCKQVKPIADFTIPRHRLCTQCRTHGVIPRVEKRLVGRNSPTLNTRTGPILAYEMLRPRDYAVEYARLKRADHEAWLRVTGKPVREVKYRSIKKCVRCKLRKPANQFDHPRDRICLSCYNPTISTAPP